MFCPSDNHKMEIEEAFHDYNDPTQPNGHGQIERYVAVCPECGREEWFNSRYEAAGETYRWGEISVGTILEASKTARKIMIDSEYKLIHIFPKEVTVYKADKEDFIYDAYTQL